MNSSIPGIIKGRRGTVRGKTRTLDKSMVNPPTGLFLGQYLFAVSWVQYSEFTIFGGVVEEEHPYKFSDI